MKPTRHRHAPDSLREHFGLQCRRNIPAVMPLSQCHNEVELNFVESGEIRYVFGGKQCAIGEGQLALFWGNVPHQVTRLSPGTVIYWLTLPLPTFLGWNLPPQLNESILNGLVVIENAKGSEKDRHADNVRFEQWESDLAQNNSNPHQIALLEIEARVRRLGLTLPANNDSSRRPSGIATQAELSKVDRITVYVAEHYQEPLQVCDLARAVGLNPNYALTLFRREFGISLMQYVTQFRLTHAQRLLATTDDTVLSIALQAGFGSVSRFYAVFKSACKQSPNEFRAELNRG